MLRKLTARGERWPLSRPFRISRGVKTQADVVTVEIAADGAVGMGEATPYGRYGETTDSVLTQIEGVRAAIEAGASREALQVLLPAGAARNALDCALWDIEAKLCGRTVAEMIGAPEPRRMVTAVTISLDAPSVMGEAANSLSGCPLIKVKVDANDPVAAVRAVREAAPLARLIVDPNESWSVAQLEVWQAEMCALEVALLEQPIPAEEDRALERLKPLVPICADEAVHVRADLKKLAGRYQAVNIKLDKTGGLTEALALREAASAMGMTLMVGCMIGTSLAMTPALHVARDANFVDLDGPWWLAQDRENRLVFSDGWLTPPSHGWGMHAARP
ncbi:N-acetyl-D-Glu racemase DgcA [Vitreimonas sp.]|jgi:L-alanine-DL-glutamate epimerase-like enolase superfamily enzyme|uniref:N-acetyl-D-Glu racemase DgcA n=1 Tax=Vitreimonas sp. TaxID=3069702 RepID=UPI002ED80085